MAVFGRLRSAVQDVLDEWLVRVPFHRHVTRLHNADYEACSYPWCRVGTWYERSTRFHERSGSA